MTDICSVQVDYVEPSQNTISLKMIPRIDLDRIKAKMSLVGSTCVATLRGGASASLRPVCACRRTGSPRGRSSRGPASGCLTPRRSGRTTAHLASTGAMITNRG